MCIRDRVLVGYDEHAAEFAVVLHGLDMDGDGKVDSVEML